MPNRRDFLLLRPGRAPRPHELDCEPLYMRYLDSLDDMTSDELLASVARDLRDVTAVVVKRSHWLSREDFRAWLAPLLDELHSHGLPISYD